METLVSDSLGNRIAPSVEPSHFLVAEVDHAAPSPSLPMDRGGAEKQRGRGSFLSLNFFLSRSHPYPAMPAISRLLISCETGKAEKGAIHGLRLNRRTALFLQ